jgi:hypothetical protein
MGLFTRDTKERKKSKLAIKTKREKLKTLTFKTSLSTSGWTFSNKIIFWNRSYFDNNNGFQHSDAARISD